MPQSAAGAAQRPQQKPCHIVEWFPPVDRVLLVVAAAAAETDQVFCFHLRHGHLRFVPVARQTLHLHRPHHNCALFHPRVVKMGILGFGRRHRRLQC